MGLLGSIFGNKGEQDKTVDYTSMEHKFRNSKSRLTSKGYDEVWEKHREGGGNYKDLVEAQYLKENPSELEKAIKSGYIYYSSNPLLKELKDSFYKSEKNPIQKVQENTENALYEIDDEPPELRPEQEELFEEYVKKIIFLKKKLKYWKQLLYMIFVV